MTNQSPSGRGTVCLIGRGPRLDSIKVKWPGSNFEPRGGVERHGQSGGETRLFESLVLARNRA